MTVFIIVHHLQFTMHKSTSGMWSKPSKKSNRSTTVYSGRNLPTFRRNVLPPCPTPKKEGVPSFELLLSFYQTTRRHTP
jgi:hypothetical protein